MVRYTLSTNGYVTWINGPGVTDGKIRVKFDGAANHTADGHVGDGQLYELRVMLTDGSYLTVKAGTINVLESLVDNP